MLMLSGSINKSFVFTLVLILTGFFGIVNGDQMTAPQNDTDFMGSDYSSVPLDTPDPLECEKMCASDDKCMAYTYVKPGYQGDKAVCYLKSLVPNSSQNKCCISGIKSQTGSDNQNKAEPMLVTNVNATLLNNDGLLKGRITPDQTLKSPMSPQQENTDLMGSDYSSVSLDTPSPSACENMCASDDKCKAYTYVKPGIKGDKAVCYLKNTVPSSSSNECCVSGVKSTSGEVTQDNNGEEIIPNIDLSKIIIDATSPVASDQYKTVQSLILSPSAASDINYLKMEEALHPNELLYDSGAWTTYIPRGWKVDERNLYKIEDPSVNLLSESLKSCINIKAYNQNQGKYQYNKYSPEKELKQSIKDLIKQQALDIIIDPHGAEIFNNYGATCEFTYESKDSGKRHVISTFVLMPSGNIWTIVYNALETEFDINIYNQIMTDFNLYENIDYSVADKKFGNRFSSVPEVNTFYDTGYKGAEDNFWGDVWKVGNYLNDEISGLIIVKGQYQFFEHDGYQGQKWGPFPYPKMIPNVDSIGIPNDIISSMKVIGFDSTPSDKPEVILFWDENFRGEHMHIFDSVTNVGEFNDEISSFIVRKGTWKFYKQ